jgi:hypothetical protein
MRKEMGRVSSKETEDADAIHLLPPQWVREDPQWRSGDSQLRYGPSKTKQLWPQKAEREPQWHFEDWYLSAQKKLGEAELVLSGQRPIYRQQLGKEYTDSCP